MSRKHNCPKRGRRSKSRYPQRLAARGLRTAPQMEDLDTLRARQSRRPRPWTDDAMTLADVLGEYLKGTR